MKKLLASFLFLSFVLQGTGDKKSSLEDTKANKGATHHVKPTFKHEVLQNATHGFMAGLLITMMISSLKSARMNNIMNHAMTSIIMASFFAKNSLLATPLQNTKSNKLNYSFIPTVLAGITTGFVAAVAAEIAAPIAFKLSGLGGIIPQTGLIFATSGIRTMTGALAASASTLWYDQKLSSFKSK